MLKFFLIYTLLATLGIDCGSFRGTRDTDAEPDWLGKWFPQKPGHVDDNEQIEYNPAGGDDQEEDDDSEIEDGADFISDHHSSMGVPNDGCDNAKNNLTVDWDDSLVNFTCLEDKKDYLPNYEVHPVFTCDHVPARYRAEHICMNSSIEYDEILPTFGPHRPLWAKYGEYLFLPKQRWIHNLEHGAVVMLYHPCANKNEVQFLKYLVRRCLYRHIITPYNLLPPDRPIALVTWGCRLMMSKVDAELVVGYLKSQSLRGPEMVSRDGQYDYAMMRSAEIVSNPDDTILCHNLY